MGNTAAWAVAHGDSRRAIPDRPAPVPVSPMVVNGCRAIVNSKIHQRAEATYSDRLENPIFKVCSPLKNLFKHFLRHRSLSLRGWRTDSGLGHSHQCSNSWLVSSTKYGRPMYLANGNHKVTSDKHLVQAWAEFMERRDRASSLGYRARAADASLAKVGHTFIPHQPTCPSGNFPPATAWRCTHARRRLTARKIVHAMTQPTCCAVSCDLPSRGKSVIKRD